MNQFYWIGLTDMFHGSKNLRWLKDGTPYGFNRFHLHGQDGFQNFSIRLEKFWCKSKWKGHHLPQATPYSTTTSTASTWPPPLRPPPSWSPTGASTSPAPRPSPPGSTALLLLEALRAKQKKRKQERIYKAVFSTSLKIDSSWVWWFYAVFFQCATSRKLLVSNLVFLSKFVFFYL